MFKLNLFSQRKKLEKGLSDVYTYECIPEKLKNQIVYIIRGSIGNSYTYGTPGTTSKKVYSLLCNQICREHGLSKLSNNYSVSVQPEEALMDFFIKQQDYEICLDVIELAFGVINNHIRNNKFMFKHASQSPDDAIEELNNRFKESSIGYEFIDNQIIQIDSQFLHSEVVKPTLHLLTVNSIYKGTMNEFLSAHSHYRNNHYKECLNDCLKSFESIMKAIHVEHLWTFNETDTAKKLINSCFNNNLIPIYLENQFSSIRSILESGVPTIRNKEGGHGQGVDVKFVPQSLASYILHLTATNLLFLAQCNANLNAVQVQA